MQTSNHNKGHSNPQFPNLDKHYILDLSQKHYFYHRNFNDMSGNKTGIIVGAGVGGIATSVFLARNGYKVKVYEKTQSPGGRCGQILRDGHRFDLGATLLLMPDIYRDVFESLGLNLEESITMKPMPVIYKLYFSDGEAIEFTTDMARMQSQIEAIEPGSTRNFQKYISKGYKMYQIALDELLGRNFRSLFDFVNFKNLLLLIRIKTYIRHWAYAGRFFKKTNLKMAFTFQNIYVGQNPFKAPALFSMLPSAELNEGTLFPEGGMFSIVEKLVSTATSLGVEFYFNSPVERIKVNKDKAESIILEDGNEIHADIIVANADLPYVYRDLLPDRKSSARLDNLKYSCSAIAFHWGLDKVYPQLVHHSVFLAEKYKENLDKIFNENSISDKPSFYVHSPVGTDPTAAPPNQDSISIIVPAGHLDQKNDQDWNTLKLMARTAVIERLKQQGMEDIEEHIKFEICYLPKTWNSIYNVSKGSVFGSVNHSILQMGYFRPHNRHNRYKNLYFVGGSTHPGNGVPLVLLSSKLTSERILRESKEK